MLKWFLKAHSQIVTITNNPRVLKSDFSPTKEKVCIVTGGGSGHKPAFIGYLGKNMEDTQGGDKTLVDVLVPSLET